MGALQKLNCPVQKFISAMLLGVFWHPLRPCWRLLWYLSCRDAFGAAVVAVEDGVVDRLVRVTSMNIHVRTFWEYPDKYLQKTKFSCRSLKA